MIIITITELTQQLGIPLAEEKTEGPSICITSLGIERDTMHQTSHLLLNKLDDLVLRIRGFIAKRKVTLKDLQQLMGQLNFVCKVVSLGSFFVRCLCDNMAGLQAPHQCVRLISV